MYTKRDRHKDRTMQAGLDLAETVAKVRGTEAFDVWVGPSLVGEALLDGLVSGA